MISDDLVRAIQKIPGTVPVYRRIMCLIKKPINALRSKKAIMSIEKGKLENASYYDLCSLQNADTYMRYLKMVHKANENRILKKVQMGERIHIAFQTSFLSTWIGDSILDLFSKDNRFEVTIILTWQTNSSKREIVDLQDHFKNRSENVVLADGSVHPEDFDIVFYLSPYLSALENWRQNDVSLNILCCYIPYGIYFAGIQENQFNLFIHQINWKNYCTSLYHIKMAKAYCRIGSYGMTYSGYPKLDNAYNEKCGEGAAWKCENSKAKIIIYAPHHSIDAVPYYSTFMFNKDFFLEYAKTHSDTTSWVYKPHPLLQISAVNSGVFASGEEYDDYVNEWRNLPNALVIEGEYLPYMATSDALILDSVSFLAEYLYFGKPILFLTRKGEKMNEFGQLLVDVLYKTEGENLEDIKEYIEHTIDSDPMAKCRERFFDEYLDYFHTNGKLAADFIYEDIVNSILKVRGKEVEQDENCKR